jgi:hypothetical protein
VAIRIDEAKCGTCAIEEREKTGMRREDFRARKRLSPTRAHGSPLVARAPPNLRATLHWRNRC